MDSSKRFVGRFGSFVSALREILPAEKIVGLDFDGTTYRVRTSFPRTVTAALTQLGLCVAQKPRLAECVVRGVPISASDEDILNDLQRHLGGKEGASIRRLHAHTEGQVDRSRPIPVVVVSVAEAAVDRLKSCKLFEYLPLQLGSSAPCERLAQCFRCFGWGRRTSACTARKRCIHCGATSHTSSSCDRPAAEKRCFACGGDHMVNWAGCPKRADFLQAR